MNAPIIFRDSNRNVIRYDGSPITWRISAYALIQKEDNMLIIKEKDRKTYGIPGGGVEMGETIEDALRRELKEEAGAQVSDIRFFDLLHQYFYHKTRKTYHQSLLCYYTAQLAAPLGNWTEEAIEDRMFVPITDIFRYPFKPELQDIIQEFISSRKSKRGS